MCVYMREIFKCACVCVCMCESEILHHEGKHSFVLNIIFPSFSFPVQFCFESSNLVCYALNWHGIRFYLLILSADHRNP